ncbi:hypothetical protein QR680_009603 [Steinernema hermaphroditum]|uniref:TAFH domain-containing protein n=1 Tax=Steinernema hermaphroditum TaxID=289476 RepID=A0AA39MA19_9BILA|nr:hypothetical protein QR680_009603 [Steinernema hermaphroditum]
MEENLVVEECGLYRAHGFTTGAMAISEKLGKLSVVRKLDSVSKKKIALNILEFWNVFECPNIFLERQIPFDGISIEAVTWKSDLVFCACTDGSVYIVSPYLSKKQRVQVCPSALWCCTSSPHSEEVFFGSDSGFVFAIGFNEDNVPIARRVLHVGMDHRIMSIACSFKNNGLKLAVGMVDRIEIHSIVSAGAVPLDPIHIDIPRQNEKKATIVWTLHFLNNHVLISGDSQGKVTFWNSNNGASYKIIPSHQADILCLAVGNNDTIFVSGVDHRIQAISGLTGGEKQFDWSTVGQRLIHEIDVRSMATYGMWLISGGAEHHLTLSNPHINVQTPPTSKYSVPRHGNFMLFTHPQYVEIWNRGTSGVQSKHSSNRVPLSAGPTKLAQLYLPKSGFITSAVMSESGRFVAVAGADSMLIYEVNLSKDRGKAKKTTTEPVKVCTTVPDVSVTAMYMTSKFCYYASGDFDIRRFMFASKKRTTLVESQGSSVLRTLVVSIDDTVAVALNCRSQLILFGNLYTAKSEDAESKIPTYRSIDLNTVPIDCRFLTNDVKSVIVLNASSKFSLTCVDLATGAQIGSALTANGLFPSKDQKIRDMVVAFSDISPDNQTIVTSSSGGYVIISDLLQKERTVLYEPTQSKYRSKCPARPFWDGSLLVQSRPSSFPSENSTATTSQVPSQNISFASIKEELPYYSSPSPSQLQPQSIEDDIGGAVRYGVPSTSSAAVLTVNMNGSVSQAQPMAVSSGSMNGNVPSMTSTVPPGQMQASGVPNGMKQIHIQHQYIPSHQQQISAVGGPVPHGTMQQHMTAAASGNVPSRPPSEIHSQLQQHSIPAMQSDVQATTKCARFFRTLIQLSNQPDHQQNAESVTNLVREVIVGEIRVEQFTSRLQQALGSKAQPHLKPFLEKTLPALRERMQQSELILEGINLNHIAGIRPLSDHSGSTFSSPESMPGSVSNGQKIVAQSRTAACGMPGNVQFVQHQPATHLIKTDGSGQIVQRIQSVGVNGTLSPASALSTPPPNCVSGSSLPGVKMEPAEPATPASISSHNEELVAPASCAPGPPIASSQLAPQTSTATCAPAASGPPPEQIQTKPFTNYQMLNQYRVLAFDVLLSRIRHAMPEAVHGTSNGVGQSVLPADDHALTLLAQAAEYRLRKVLTHLSTTAEHRSEQLRSNSNYRQLDDHRRQLKFMEEMDKLEHERRENREKEALIRMSKSKGKDKDTLEKAKQIQHADQMAARNRDANAAAMAALSGTKKRRLEDPLDQSIGHGISMSLPTNRPRTKRVLTKDFMLVLSQDKFMKDSELRLRLLYTSSAKEQSL